jgi:hypothetical protein
VYVSALAYTFLRLLDVAAAWILRPVEVEPVKLTMRMSMCEASVAPDGVPWPDKMLMTPGGKPAAWTSCARRAGVKGAVNC